MMPLMSKLKVDVEEIKDLSAVEQFELIADKFAEVSNLYEPLQKGQIDFRSSHLMIFLS